MKRRRGIYLPIAAVIITTLLLLAVSRITLSQRHLSTVARLAKGEQAFQLASSASLIGQKLLMKSATFINEGKNDQPPPALAPIIEALKNKDGLLLREAVVPLDAPQIEYLRSMASPDELDLTLVLGPVVPLYEQSSNASLSLSPREATVTISIVAKAKVGKSERTVRAFTQGRLINITPPVIGKFVLFTRSFGPRKLNSLSDSLSADNISELPLVLYSGESSCPQDKKDKSEFLTKQGWCFLGGPDEWELNLSLCGGREEGEEGVLQRGLSTSELPSDSVLVGKGSFAFYSCDSPLHRDLGSAQTRNAFSLLPEESYAQSSLLNLWGTLSKTTPTIVIGSVYRRFARVKGLLNEDTGVRAPFPYLDSTRFNSTNWPGGVSAGTISLLQETFHNEYFEYEKQMCNVVKEDYNKGLTLIGDKEVDDVTSLEVDGFPAKPSSIISGNAYTLKDDKGRSLFRGANFDNLRSLDFLKQKASFIFSSGKDFFSSLRKGDGSLALGGAVLVNGNLVIDEPLTIKDGEGGLVLVTGDITLRSDISSPTKEPLTLVSLGGNITVKQCDQVDCGLIALEGKISLEGAIDIRGLLACKEILLPKSSSLVERKVTYNERLDPTDSENVEKNWRLQMQKEWQILVH